MGEPKLRPDAAKGGGRNPAGVLENPGPIAQRFAYSADSRQTALRVADAPPTLPPTEPMAAEPAMAPPLRGRWAFGPRILVSGLTFAVLVPSLILAALWLGLNGATESAPAALPPETQAVAPSAVLTTADRIEAVAGEAASFPVALDGTDGVPSRSVITIKGLPQGSNLTEGRPYGDNEWTLKPDQIGDLSLALPAGANGEFRLGIALIAPDDKVIAEAETLLVVAPAQAAPIAAEGSGVLSPGEDEAAASALVQDGAEAAAPVSDSGEAAAPAPVPDLADGDAAEPEAQPAPMETASIRSGGAQPNEVGRSEADENGLGSVQPSVFVNMREGPSSSSSVLAVIAKGANLAVLDRKRGWVQVTDPASGKQGWIYSGLLAGEAKTDRRIRRVAPAEGEPKSESESESVWGRVGRWLSPSKEN